MDFEDAIVRDLTALRGTIRVEDEKSTRTLEIPEGTAVNHGDDNTQMTAIVIMIK